MSLFTLVSFDLVGEDVLITGAGPIGCMAAAIARRAGARHIVATDINSYRLDLAKRMGATRTIDVSREKLDGQALMNRAPSKKARFGRTLCLFLSCKALRSISARSMPSQGWTCRLSPAKRWD